MDAWGRCDILVNNAGILRDKSFDKMEIEDFEVTSEVHYMGTVNHQGGLADHEEQQIRPHRGHHLVHRPVRQFRPDQLRCRQNVGDGLMNSLKLEGAKDNIKVNAICPVGGTRMTETLMPPAVLKC